MLNLFAEALQQAVLVGRRVLRLTRPIGRPSPVASALSAAEACTSAIAAARSSRAGAAAAGAEAPAGHGSLSHGSGSVSTWHGRASFRRRSQRPASVASSLGFGFRSLAIFDLLVVGRSFTDHGRPALRTTLLKAWRSGLVRGFVAALGAETETSTTQAVTALSSPLSASHSATATLALAASSTTLSGTSTASHSLSSPLIRHDAS